MSIPDPALCVCVREREREQKVFIIKIKNKCNSRWAKMPITDPPLPNVINAGALYTNYNTFQRKIYEHESKNVLDES